MSLMAELRNSEARRSKSARKLVQYVLQDPQAVLSMPIAQLAAEAEVSEPTVNRFCTSLGLKGFPDFKLTLAGELGRAQPGISSDIVETDDEAAVIAKVFDSTRASLSRAQNQLDCATIERTVEILNSARSIVFCGLGASSSVALDAQHKFLRFGTPVIAHTDAINQRMITASLQAEDCIICISYSGRTLNMIDVAKMAGDAGAKVVGITAPGSPLAKQCALVLPVDSGEDTELYTPMTSRIAQLVLIDVLASNLAIKKGPAFSEQLQRAKLSVANTRKRNL